MNHCQGLLTCTDRGVLLLKFYDQLDFSGEFLSITVLERALQLGHLQDLLHHPEWLPKVIGSIDF